MGLAGELINHMCRFVMRTGVKIDGFVVDHSDGFLKVEVYRYIYELGGNSGTVFTKQDKTIFISFEDISTIIVVYKWSVPGGSRLLNGIRQILKKTRFAKK